MISTPYRNPFGIHGCFAAAGDLDSVRSDVTTARNAIHSPALSIGRKEVQGPVRCHETISCGGVFRMLMLSPLEISLDLLKQALLCQKVPSGHG